VLQVAPPGSVPEQDPIEAAAQFMAAQPGAAERTLRTHIRLDDGRCAGCGQSQLIWWPCTLANIALAASRPHPTPGRPR